MNLNRRDFLKGLMALTGAAVVGLPASIDDVLPVASETVPSWIGDFARPVGKYGSVRIGDRWYALHGYSLDISRGYIDLGPSTPRCIPALRQWTIEFDLDTMPRIDMDDPITDIEIDVEGHGFQGTAVLAATSVDLGAYEQVHHLLSFDGIGDLVCKDA